MKWWKIALILFAVIYLAGIIYQIFFEDKKAHRVNVMRRNMMLADKSSLIRRLSYAENMEIDEENYDE